MIKYTYDIISNKQIHDLDRNVGGHGGILQSLPSAVAF